MTDPVRYDGELGEVGLSPALAQLSEACVTGILTVQSEEDIIAISFEDGSIVGADALNETLEDGLGQALTGEGLLTEAQFAAVLSRVRAERRRLGELLVEEEMLSPEDYLAALRRYTVTLIQRCLSWRGGDYKFYEGDEVSYEEGFEAIRVAEVVATAPSQAKVVPEVEAPPEEPAEAEEESAPTPMPIEGPPRFDEPPIVAPVPEEPVADDRGPGAGLLAQLRRRLAVDEEGVPGWLSWLVPGLVVVIFMAVAWSRPHLVLYPAFWLEPERLAFEKERRASVYWKIDRAARTFFLLEGRFPDDLHTLVGRGLLSTDDIVGTRGRILSYIPGDRGYVIRSAVTDGTDPGVNEEEAISGDFFLDPEFVILAPETDSIPLVLLD